MACLSLAPLIAQEAEAQNKSEPKPCKTDPRGCWSKGRAKQRFGDCLAETYAGYLVEVQNRVCELRPALRGHGFISESFQNEVWVIHI